MVKKKPSSRVNNKCTTMPEFKPGNKPHTVFGKEILNNNVPWDNIVRDILGKGITKSHIAKEAELERIVIEHILQKDYDTLNFRSGARILSIHCRVCPREY